MQNSECRIAPLLILHSAFCISAAAIIRSMSAEASPPPPSRRGRLLWTLLGAMIVVGLLPLVISHYFLIGINRDSLETLEKKYLTRSAVSIATDVQTTISSNTQQLAKIAASVRALKSALPPGSDPFTYAARSNIIGDYITPDSEVLGLRILDRAGHGAQAVPPNLDRGIVQELDLALGAAAQGQPYTGTFQYLTLLNQPAVVVAVPVGDGSQVIGSVEGIVSLRRITERIREEGKVDVTAFLVDRNGKVLIHSEPSIDVQRPDVSGLKIVGDFMNAPARLTAAYNATRYGPPPTTPGP